MTLVKIPHWNTTMDCPSTDSPLVTNQPHVLSLGVDTPRGRRRLRKLFKLAPGSDVSDKVNAGRNIACMKTLKGCYDDRSKVMFGIRIAKL